MSKKPDAARDSAVSQENRTVLPEESHENKTRTAIWLSPGVIRRMDGWLQEDNCKTRSEFIEKAIQFYAGYLYAQQSQDYLPRIITSTLKGITAESTNQISRVLFKLAVEQAITMNVVAATCNISREQLEKLRGTCVAQVKRSNGSYSFEDAFDFQKR